MRSRTNGGLAQIAGVGDGAANEEAAERVVPAKEHGEDSTAGWDPYDVWRKRVKEPRTLRDEPGITHPRAPR
jgi:hypothetical protein